jgi:hypothetical protein
VDKEAITRMAREAGGADITSHGWTSWVGTQSTDFLERFAALVADQNKLWVGLTDDEIALIVGECAASHRHDDVSFAREIEAKLREKNT